MIDNEAQEKHIFDLVPEEIRETTVSEQIGNVTVIRVDPEKVARLVRLLQENGVTQVKYGNETRILDPELAKKLAQVAGDILGYTVEEFRHQNVPLNTAINWGSTTTGLVSPKSDIDIQLHLPTVNDLETAGRLLRNSRFHDRLWGLQTEVRVPAVVYALSVPSMYQKQPGEKWIPEAHDNVTIQRLEIK